MQRGRVVVEINPQTGKAVRIFKNGWKGATIAMVELDFLREIPRRDAVEQIRDQVFQRAANACERCGHPLTGGTMHMDEKISRGEGGEVSLQNCWALCYNCHEGRTDSEHGDRRPRFGEYN